MFGLLGRKRKGICKENFHEISEKVKVDSISVIWPVGRIVIHLTENDETSYNICGPISLVNPISFLLDEELHLLHVNFPYLKDKRYVVATSPEGENYYNVETHIYLGKDVNFRIVGLRGTAYFEGSHSQEVVVF